jgi:23S rRNA (guanosine2251-2'-O)-methyltransferase
VIVYGRNPVREALRGPRAVQRIWATAGAMREPWLARTEVHPAVVSADEVQRICASTGHQGVCAQVESYRYASAEEVLADAAPLIVALDQVQDPQNLGSICRTAECAGATAVVIPERRAAEVTPAVCKASAGAVEHLTVARVRNLADFLTAAKAAGAWCYGAAAGARTRYDQVELGGAMVLVLGGEGKGLRPRVAETCDELLALPIRGRVQSLNVSAAAAVLIYAATRGRRCT